MIKRVKNWKAVTIAKTRGSSYNVLLDNDHLLSELGNIIELPKKLAISVAEEWRRNEDIEEIKKKTQSLIQVSMKLGEAVYKNQQKDQNKKTDSQKEENTQKENKENVVDADFEDVKEDKEKSA